jgi:hypothetical protein
MKNLLDKLPGPAPLRVLLFAVIVIAALAVLLAVLEYLGPFLDQGGTPG